MCFWKNAKNISQSPSLAKNQSVVEWLSTLKNEVVLVPMPTLSVVRLTGKDARRFLQGQSTCDVEHLQENEGTVGAVCTPKGRMVANFRLIAKNEALFLVLPTDNVENFLNHLKKYIVFFQAELSVCSTLGVLYSRESSLLGYPAAMTLSPQHQLYLLTEDMRDQLLESDEMQFLPETVGYALDLSAGFAHIRGETSEQFLPHEAGLIQAGGVSFSKGCYTGQEIIARMHYRGKLKFMPTIVEVTGELPARHCVAKELKGAADIIDYVKLSDANLLAIASLSKSWLAQKTIVLENDAILTIITNLADNEHTDES